jgi:hypothetical protein
MSSSGRSLNFPWKHLLSAACGAMCLGRSSEMTSPRRRWGHSSGPSQSPSRIFTFALAICWGKKWGKVPHRFQPIST